MIQFISFAKARILLFSLLAICLLAACDLGSLGLSDSSTNQAQATVDALSTENARLAKVATAAAQTSVATPAANAARAATPLSTTTASTLTQNIVPVPAPAAEPGPLPNLLAELPLAPQGAALIDFRLDQATNHLYVSDNAGHLYILDATTHALLATLPVAGALTLDPTLHRLYVAPGDLYFMDQPVISVVDTQALTVTATLTDATHLALDPTHNRLFVGKRIVANEAQAPGVRIFHADALAPVATVAQAGIPVYNPLRNELLIVAYTIYSADPDQARVKQDLLPEISQQTLPWCNGCKFANQAYVFPDDNLVAFDVQEISLGKGAGLIPPPRFFNATDLTPIEKPADIPTFQPTCGSQKSLLKAVNGQLYRHLSYDRYIFNNNWLVEDLNGQVLTWRDGLEAPFVNARTNQAYANGWVLDLASLNPIGQLPAVCIFMQDDTQGLLYASRQGALAILNERGGQWNPPSPAAPGPLPEKAISQIVPSPNYAADHTLFLIAEHSRLYRSTDGGQTWTMLRGALPMNAFATLSLAISPAFATDHTLFTGGYVGEGWGEGVMRSMDGGGSWQPMWHQLNFLRVYQIALSPNYAADGTLVAYAHYTRLTPRDTGVALQRSTDRGMTWSVALTATDEAKAPSATTIFSTTAAALPLRMASNHQQLEYTLDQGQSWQPLALTLPQGAAFAQIVPSPGYPADGVLYILSDNELWRAVVNDASPTGLTIQPWGDARLAGRDLNHKLTALAVSPKLSDGTYQLLIGTAAGEFWALDAASIQWQAPDAAANRAATGTQPAVSTTATEPTPAAATNVTPTQALTVTLVPFPSPTRTPGGPTATPPPPLAGEPPAGLYRPSGSFDRAWADDTRLQQALGWAKEPEPDDHQAAYQTFERGTMIWRNDTKRIYVLYADRTWDVFKDPFKEGDPESDPSLRVPQGKLQPVRGFGQIWREHDAVREKLGWATAKEQGLTVPVHNFEHGFMIRISGLVYGLVEQADGKRIWY